ncbi:Transcription factor atf21 [Fusarium albosuccineum]|uniref:Transcription factor atf21 n=1 Tax=Fusarium albosuccineum TaxID=1237068 RepID=A0A8H4PK59_9HYPO|nr:Transcription factor atf21 [Fusarium albosuccineum]
MANAPASSMNNVDSEAMTANYGPLYNFPWEQWYAASQSVLPDPSDGTAHDPSLYTQDAHQHNDLASGYPTPEGEKWAASFPNYDYSVLSSISESLSPTDPSSKSPGTKAPSSAQREKRKRKRNTNERAPAKPSRRGSSKKNSSPATAEDTRQDSNPRGAQAAGASAPPSPDQQVGGHTKKVQERNRIASNKFRVKKREDAKKLKSDEEDMERINHDLSSCVADLTHEVYQLRMKLLQHTDCECSLIQSYIANEAHRYIRDMDEDKSHEVHCQP